MVPAVRPHLEEGGIPSAICSAVMTTIRAVCAFSRGVFRVACHYILPMSCTALYVAIQIRPDVTGSLILQVFTYAPYMSAIFVTCTLFATINVLASTSSSQNRSGSERVLISGQGEQFKEIRPEVMNILRANHSANDLRSLLPFYEGPEQGAIQQAILQKEKLEQGAKKEVVVPITPANIQLNRQAALRCIYNLRPKVQQEYELLKVGQERALETLAERETGTAEGLLHLVPDRKMKQFLKIPAKIEIGRELKNNPARENLLPGLVRAAEKLASFKEDQSTIKEALLRLAQMNVLERNFALNDQVLNFNLESILKEYAGNVPLEKLHRWYDFAFPGDLSLKAEFQAALKKYNSPTTVPEQAAKECLSCIHDLAQKKLAQTEPGSPEEQSLKEIMRTFITQVVDANRNCVDQMNSQLEDLLLDLLADHLNNGSINVRFQFKAGLALFQQRARLIKAFVRELNPDFAHMADLERYTSQQVAQSLRLKDAFSRVGAAFDFYGFNARAKIVAAAVKNKYNAPFFLLEETQASHNSVSATYFLRQQLIQHVGEHILALHEIENENDPLLQELALYHEAGATPVVEGGTLTFEGTIFYLMEVGILYEKRRG